MNDMGWDNERSSYYDRGISSGGAVVTIIGARIVEEATGLGTPQC